MPKKINSRLNNHTLANQGSAKSKVLIVIVGPTASGKSEIALKLAKKFNGQIISADSRQVYKGMNIGTAKTTKKEMEGIAHSCIDVVSPKRKFTVVQYRKLALRAIKEIFKKGKVPILCGGTGFYIEALVDGIVIPQVKPDWRLRSALEQLTTKELFLKLKKLDKRRAKTIERTNRRRLIRALEIVIKTKKPIPLLKKKLLAYPALIIGIKKSSEELKKRIIERVEKMFKTGLKKEVKNLVKKHGWPSSLQTIGYQEWQGYFNKKIDKKELKELIKIHTIQYAKRQIIWFKRDKRIRWIKNYKEAEKLVKEFLK